MSQNWATDAEAIRTVLADQRDMSEPVSEARLRELGYMMPGFDDTDARIRNDAREAVLLRRLSVVPEQMEEA